MSDQPTIENNLKPDGNQKLLLTAGIGSLVFLVVSCLVFASVLLFVDPLKLNLLPRLTGKYDAAAEAMPEDTLMYAGVNLLNITPEKLARVLSPFQDLLEEEAGEPITTLHDLTTRLDSDVLSQLDMTFAEDIQPWIGQYLGFGLVDFQLGEYQDLETVDFVGSLEVRNRKAADAFLEKLTAKLAETSGDVLVQTEYRGVMIYQLSVANAEDQLVLARSGNLLLVSNQARNLKRSIDGQKEASLANDPVFSELLGKLPKDKILSVYLSGDRLTELLLASSGALGGAGFADSLQSLDSMALSVSIVDEGLQIDNWTAYDPEALDEEQNAMLETTGDELELAHLLPAGTVFYTGGTHLDLIWLANKTAMAQTTGMGEDWEAAMEMFAGQFGFNPDTELFPYLDGEWGMAVMPATEGILVQQMQVPLGALVAAQATQPDQLAGVVEGFASSMEAVGAPVEDVALGDATLKQVSDPMMGPLFAFGISDERLVIATSSSAIGVLNEDQETLAESERYKQVVRALPRGMRPMLYLNLEKLFADIRGNLSDRFLANFDESIRSLKPIQYVIAGNAAFKNDLLHSVVIVFIQPVE